MNTAIAITAPHWVEYCWNKVPSPIGNVNTLLVRNLARGPLSSGQVHLKVGTEGATRLSLKLWNIMRD